MESKKVSDDQKFLEEMKEFLKNSQENQRRISESITNCQETRKQAIEAIDKVQKFKDEMGTIMAGLAEKFSEQVTMNTLFTRIKDPEISQSNITHERIIQLLNDSQSPVFLTGAGISVASGMPTFRGSGGIWTQNDQNFDPKDVCKFSFFKQNPELYWKWNNEFLQKVRDCRPNINHHRLAELQDYYEKQNKSFTLITSNIDGYHVEAKKNKELFHKPSYGQMQDVYEIHGNMNYFRCQEQCEPFLFDAPLDISQERFVHPVCPKCEKEARPHILFFDECYDEKFYRKNTVVKKMFKCDLLFVVGTMLETNLSEKIVEEVIRRKGQVIEINPLPVIEGQGVWRQKGKAEDILPGIIESFLRQKQYYAQQKNEIKQSQNNKNLVNKSK